VTLAYVGIGSNLENPRAQVASALLELDSLPKTKLIARSSLYRSAPVGCAAQPDFVNAVASLETALAPRELLASLQALEQAHRRTRSFANAPRTLDLDLLLYGDARIDEAGLVVPHPRMHERAFVLRPLVEIDARAEIPGHGRAAERLAECAAQAVERMP